MVAVEVVSAAKLEEEELEPELSLKLQPEKSRTVHDSSGKMLFKIEFSFFVV